MWIDDDDTYCIRSIDHPLTALHRKTRRDLLTTRRTKIATLMDEITDVEEQVSDSLPQFAAGLSKGSFRDVALPAEKLAPLRRLDSFEALHEELPRFVTTMEPRWRLDAADVATSLCEIAYYGQARRIAARLGLV